MKKIMSLIAASMFVSAVAFAQVPEQNQQQGTVPEQNQTTMPEQNQTQPQPQQSPLPQQNQTTTPEQNQQQGTTPEPNPDQMISPQQQEQQGGFPQKDTTSPAISDTSKPLGTGVDTSGTVNPPRR